MKNLVSTLALPFFVGSSSLLQVTSTAIKAWMGSKLGKIGSGSEEFATLERLEFHSSAFIFIWIFIILVGNKGNHTSLNELEFLPDPITNY